MPLTAACLFLNTRQRLSTFDLVLITVYLIGITLFGLRFREKKSDAPADKSLRSYFLANNTIPWWAIALSIVSAETSTLTIISIPGVAFAGDFGFLQVVIGYMLGRIVVAGLFLPRYFAGEMLTAYQLIDQRFGPALHKVTAGLFLFTRAAAEGVRVFAVSIVVGIAIGTGDVLSISIICLLTLLYTFEGGMAAVIWTDVVQMAIYIGGTLVAIYTLGSHVPGGWSTIHTIGAAAGKFHMLNFAFNLKQSYTFWAGVLGGTFLTMASHGTDQLMVQRMLAARSLRESRLALLSSGVVIFVQFAFFLFIGVGLYVFYGQHPAAFSGNDRIFPTFIVSEMPRGISGLLIAAILAAAMSNLSAALNSLSSSTVVDFYTQLRPNATDRERTFFSKGSTLFWALVLFAIAIATVSVGGKGHVVEIALSIASVAYGCLLGVFLLGTLTKFATQIGASIGMICGFALNVWLWQGDFPVHLGPITIPHIAFTWYVLIGAIATFVIGSLCSLFGKRSTIPIAAVLICLTGTNASSAQALTYDFTPASTLINDAIAAHKLPGAVLVVGHNGKVVFHQAYGERKLNNEPGLDGKPSPAEPMTEDTIFDMASLTKDLATATSVMQLYDAGKIKSFDDPIEKYLPLFNPDHDTTRSKVTLRLLLTHFSGEPPDIALKDPWGLATPDRAEGFRRALAAKLSNEPGAKFVYSDINFILLGLLVETLSGQTEDIYTREHIFLPLGMMDTRYLPIEKACGPHKNIGAAITWAPKPPGKSAYACPKDTWSTSLLPNIAPTTHDDEGNAQTNPHFDMLTRGTVHDPTTRRMGGVAGHAGIFSTAHDVSLYASSLLEKLLHNTGPFPVKQSTLQLMVAPEQPGHSPDQLIAAQKATDAQIAAGEKGTEPGLAPNYPAVKGQDIRGYGWDIDTAFSKPRGMVFPIGSFGHTGFTGTTLWMDAASDSYVVLLSNAVHSHTGKPISNLRGEVATAVAQALRLSDCSPKADTCDIIQGERPEIPVQSGTPISDRHVLTGIDVLEADHFVQLKSLAAEHNNQLVVGILTNQTGLDSRGLRTIDQINALRPEGIKLLRLFSPEHGIFGRQDSTKIDEEMDPATHIVVTSLYGTGAAARHPHHEQIQNLDAVVIDIQDLGVHYWTYESAVAYFLEASDDEWKQYHHRLEIVVLDRPNPIGGLAMQGPVVDADHTSYIAYMPLPTRHGLTIGEFARYVVAQKHLDTALTVVPMRGWQRSMFYADTGVPWIKPSPNMPTPEAAILYPALGEIEGTNISVGRGTGHAFSFFGAGVPFATKSTSTAMGGLTSTETATTPHQWFHAKEVADYLNARHIVGATFTCTQETIAEDTNHYPFHGQTIEAVHITYTDAKKLDTPELGIEIASALHKLYPNEYHVDRLMTLIANQATTDAVKRGDDPHLIETSWGPALGAYKSSTAPILLYR